MRKQPKRRGRGKAQKAHKENKRERKVRRTWSYTRAFILTIGIGMAGVCALAWQVQGERAGNWPPAAWALLGALALSGFGFGGYAGSQKVFRGIRGLRRKDDFQEKSPMQDPIAESVRRDGYESDLEK